MPAVLSWEKRWITFSTKHSPLSLAKQCRTNFQFSNCRNILWKLQKNIFSWWPLTYMEASGLKTSVPWTNLWKNVHFSSIKPKYKPPAHSKVLQHFRVITSSFNNSISPSSYTEMSTQLRIPCFIWRFAYPLITICFSWNLFISCTA